MTEHAAVEHPTRSPSFVLFAERPRRLHLSGELDVAGTADFVNALNAAVRLGGTIELHLAELSSIDWPAINALVDAVQRLGERGRVVLFDPMPAVRRVIEVCGLQDTFEITRFSPRVTDESRAV